MLIPVRCPSCGNSACGTVAGVFRVLVERERERLCVERGVRPENLALDFDAQLDLDALLTACGVPRSRYCCRAVLLTTIELATRLVNARPMPPAI